MNPALDVRQVIAVKSVFIQDKMPAPSWSWVGAHLRVCPFYLERTAVTFGAAVLSAKRAKLFDGAMQLSRLYFLKNV